MRHKVPQEASRIPQASLGLTYQGRHHAPQEASHTAGGLTYRRRPHVPQEASRTY